PDRSLSFSTVVCLGGMRVAAGRFVAMILEFRYTRWANIKRYLRTILFDYARFDDALLSYFYPNAP
ncbi:MAG: hypothetical protein KIC74_06325, partial [Neisseria sp.]|nr:hypothetical protein [Neisseria sp.]